MGLLRVALEMHLMMALHLATAQAFPKCAQQPLIMYSEWN
jgi:hypothetical protein